MSTLPIKQPSALAPIAMSGAAFAVCVGYAAIFGTARQSDEGTAAHLWQLLMVGQMPVILYFAVRWLPKAPRHGLLILVLQIGAALAAMFPVWWFGW
ncbi:MAG: hypothetical protein ACRD1V_06390 [Vicinamibacterales bacterium]